MKNKIVRVSALRKQVTDPNGPYAERKHRDRTKYNRKMKYKQDQNHV
jgi:hypothetical protein